MQALIVQLYRRRDDKFADAWNVTVVGVAECAAETNAGLKQEPVFPGIDGRYSFIGRRARRCLTSANPIGNSLGATPLSSLERFYHGRFISISLIF